MKLISIGQSCFIKMNIINVFCNQETHIFDWSITTPDVLLDCLNTDFKYYSLTDNVTIDEEYKKIENIFSLEDRKTTKYNKYGNFFIHHPDITTLNMTYEKRKNRFIELINSDEKIFMIYCDYSYIFSDTNANWNEIHIKQDELYKVLEQCSIILKNKNKNINIISVNTNKEYYSNIIINININENLLLIKDIETRKKKFFYIINNYINNLLKKH